MSDMLVKLYELPDHRPLIQDLLTQDIVIRPVLSPERHIVLAWLKEKFRNQWVSEAAVGISNAPVTCYIAVKGNAILGFACVDTTLRGFFGPTGVDEAYRGKNIGRALLLYALHKMKELGYGYAVIGGAGPIDFYKKACGATEIENSKPGIYQGLLVDSNTLV